MAQIIFDSFHAYVNIRDEISAQAETFPCNQHLYCVYLNPSCQLVLWEETGTPGKNPRHSAERGLIHLGPVYMEASYPVDRLTRFAGTNKRSVYMEPSYSALICSIHCGYMKYLNLAAKARNYKNTTNN